MNHKETNMVNTTAALSTALSAALVAALAATLPSAATADVPVPTVFASAAAAVCAAAVPFWSDSSLWVSP